MKKSSKTDAGADNTVYPSVAYMIDTINNTQTEIGGDISAVNERIDNLDLAAVSATGKAIVSVSQEAGKISATTGEIGTAGIANAAVTTAKIADANVTKAKLDSTVQASLDNADSAMQESALMSLASWTSAKCGTTGVTCSLVSKDGKIAWEAVKY